MKMSKIVLLAAGCCFVTAIACFGANPKGKDVLGKYNRFNIVKTVSLNMLDVFTFYDIDWKYNAPYKKEGYLKTDEYKKQLAELTKLKEQSKDTVYYVPVFKKLLNNNTPGIFQVHTTNVYFPGYPFTIAKPSPLTTQEGNLMESQARYLNRRYYIQTYDVPVSDELKKVFTDRGSVDYYLAFTVTGTKHVSDDENVHPAKDVLSANPVRFIAIDNRKDEVLVDMELKPKPEESAAAK